MGVYCQGDDLRWWSEEQNKDACGREFLLVARARKINLTGPERGLPRLYMDGNGMRLKPINYHHSNHTLSRLLKVPYNPFENHLLSVTICFAHLDSTRPLAFLSSYLTITRLSQPPNPTRKTQELPLLRPSIVVVI